MGIRPAHKEPDGVGHGGVLDVRNPECSPVDHPVGRIDERPRQSPLLINDADTAGGMERSATHLKPIVIRGKEVGEYGDQDQHDNNRSPSLPDAVALERPPDELPLATADVRPLFEILPRCPLPSQ